MIFSTAHSGKWDLWSVGPNGKDLKQVTDTPDEEHSPAVSPDGKGKFSISMQKGHLDNGALMARTGGGSPCRWVSMRTLHGHQTGSSSLCQIHCYRPQMKVNCGS